VGNYGVNADLKARFEGDAELSALTDTEESGVPDEDVLTEVWDDAEGQVDSYAAVLYLVPLDVTNAVVAARVKSVTADLAAWALLNRGDVVPDAKQRSYEAAIEWLKMLAKGEVRVPSPTTASTTTSRAPLSDWGTAGTTTDSKRVFTRATQARS
jgi:phage gp36-like protein